MLFHLEIECENLGTLYQHFLDIGLTPDHPPTTKPWGEHDFTVRDPDGNAIEFAEAG